MSNRIIIPLMLVFAFVLPAKAIQNYGLETSVDTTTYMQPNSGTPVTFDGKFWGNSLCWERETLSGYTFVLNEVTGYWCYAILNDAGYYIPSSLRVGIDNPTGISQHLRRSAACLARLASYRDDFDDMVEAANADVQDHRDNPREFRIAILFFEFDDVKHKDDEDNHRYTQGNIDSMFVSEGVYEGVRLNQDPEAHTREGEEPFGSVRDWFDAMSSGFFDHVTISAGGPFGDDEHDLIINEIDNGEIVWLEMPYSKDDWGEQVEYPENSNQFREFNNSLVRQIAEDDGLIVWNAQPSPYDRLIYLHAGNGDNVGGGWAWRNGNLGLSELQSWPAGPSIGVYDENGDRYSPAKKLRNIGDFCHELMHACEGVPDPYDNSSADIMTYGTYQSPKVEYGSYDDVTYETCTHKRSTCPTRPNPQFLAQSGWVNLEEITEDMIGENQLVISYSLSAPEIFYFDYDVSGDEGGEGRFFLENRHMVTEAEEDENIDFNSYSMGCFDWGFGAWSPDEIGGNRVPLNITGDKSNLHIWHREGWKDVDFTSSRRALSRGIMLENADGVPDGDLRGDGNDLFPGSYDITEFGPGTGEHYEFSGGGPRTQVPAFDEDNFLFGSSHDIVGLEANLTDYRELQTGFCVKEIEADGNNITCDVYTNYWGGDVTEDLTLEGTNIYLGQGCEIQENASITITSENDDCTVNLDSDVTNRCGTMTFNPGENNCEVNLNDLVYWTDGTFGGDVEFAAGNGQISFVGPGHIFTDFTGNIRIDNTNVELTGTGWDLTIGVNSEWHVGDGGVLRFENTGENECTVFLLDDLVLESGSHFIVLQTNGDITFRGPGQLVIQDDADADFEGSANAHIVFTSDEDIPARGDCGGIVFEDVTVAHTISYVDIEYATEGIKADNCGSYLTLSNVTVTDFKNYGFNLISSSPTLDNCSASNSTPSGSIQPVGLYCYNSSPDITDCDFDNNYKGVEVHGTSSTLEMGTTTVDDNDSDGLYIYDGFAYLYYTATKPDYGYNTITGNGNEGVYAGGYAGVYMGYGTSSPGNNSIYSNYSYDVANYTAYTVQAEYNWWNDVMGPSSIYGTVDYTPWLVTAPGSFAPVDNGDVFIDEFDDGEEDLFLQADSLFDCGEYGDALAIYMEIVEDYPNDARILNVIRRVRDCYKGLNRNDDWRQGLRNFNQNQRIRAQVRPMLASLRVNDLLENSDNDDARTLLQGALRNLDRGNDSYPSLLFQLGMLYHYSQNDPIAAAEVFNIFMNSFEDHPLFRSAAIEYEVCVEEGRNIDTPGQPENMVDPGLPTEFNLHPPFPNPFNDVVTIRFAVPKLNQVRITLFDVLGRKVQDVVDVQYKAGVHNVQMSGRNLNSGIYFCQMTASGFEQTRKLVYVK